MVRSMTSEVVRLVGGLAARVDAELARAAIRNAEESLAADDAKRVEYDLTVLELGIGDRELVAAGSSGLA